MKYSQTLAASLTIGALATALSVANAQSVKPIVISPPAVHDGSNWSRAPFPAQRQENDVTPADGKAIDETGPNSPVANIEPPVPANRIGVGQPAQSTYVASTTTTEPVLTPTGRATVYATPTATTTYVQSSAKPVVISPPAVHDGSNWSRAPFPAQRQENDVTPADGQAIDATGPNSPVANIEPAVPTNRIAVMQSATPTVVTTEPALMPTGRATVVVAAPFEVSTYVPTIRSVEFDSREATLAEIETRLKNSEQAMSSIRSTTSQMSASNRDAFTTAANEVKEKAKALRKTLKEAHKATSAQWDSLRAQLASDYEAYAAALARIDAATGATATIQ